jgi:hypothetical protein
MTGHFTNYKIRTNHELATRPHSSLDARTPDHAYFNHPSQPAAA